MTENELSYIVRGAIFKVYSAFGPGLFESAYHAALKHELENRGLDVKSEVKISLVYEGLVIDSAFKADLIVEDKLIIELKSIENLLELHHKQLITYLKLSGIKLGLLVNFNSADMSKSIFRKINGVL